MTFGFLAALRGYLPEIELESMDDLEQRKDFGVVIAGGQNQDQDGVGVKPWRVCHVCGIVDPGRGFGVWDFGAWLY